jgi:hypothetical protein
MEGAGVPAGEPVQPAIRTATTQRVAMVKSFASIGKGICP